MANAADSWTGKHTFINKYILTILNQMIFNLVQKQIKLSSILRESARNSVTFNKNHNY